MISDKAPYSRESKSNGRRSSILKRQDSCFTSEGSNGNSECPRTPRRVSFASTATIRYMHIISTDESSVSSNNNSDTSSSSGSSQSMDRDNVFTEAIPPLQNSYDGGAAVAQTSGFVKTVCNSAEDIEMGPNNCAAASLVTEDDKTIFFTSKDMSLSDITESSLWLDDTGETNNDRIAVRQHEDNNHTILYTEADQYGCMELTSNLSQLSESLLQESNVYLCNDDVFSPEGPQNKPGLKRRPSFADGGKSDDQVFVRMYAESAKENVPDSTIIFGNRGGEEMEFTQHEIIPVNRMPHLDDTLSTSIPLKPKPKLLDDLFQLVKKKEPPCAAACSVEENLTQGVEDMEFTGDITQPVPRTALLDITTHKLQPSINQPVPPVLVNQALPHILLSQALPPIVVSQTVASIVTHTVLPIVNQELTKTDSKTVPPIANQALPKFVTQTLLPVVDQAVPLIVSETMAPISNQMVPPIANQELSKFANQALPPGVGQTVPPTVSQGVSQTVPPIVSQVVSQTMPPTVNQALHKFVNQTLPPVDQAVSLIASQTGLPISGQSLPPIVSQAQTPFVSQTVPLIVNKTVPSIVSKVQTPFDSPIVPLIVNNTVPSIVSKAQTPFVSQTVPVIVNNTVPPIVSQMVHSIVDQQQPQFVCQALPKVSPFVNNALPPTVDKAMSLGLNQTLPIIVSQGQSQAGNKTVSPFVSHALPPTTDQAMTKIVKQALSPSVDQAMTPIVSHALSSLVSRTLPTVDQAMSSGLNQALPNIVTQELSPIVSQTASSVVRQDLSLQSVLPIVDQTLSPVINQKLSSTVNQTLSPIGSPAMLPINHAMIPADGSFLSDLESVCKTEQMLSEFVNLQDLYEILGISRLERAHTKSVPVQRLPAATGREKLVAKTVSIARLCCLKQHLNEIEAAINRSEQECTEKLIQFSGKPPDILAAFQAKENSVSDLRTKAQAVIQSCRIMAQAMWKRYKVDYHMKYSEAVERECQALDFQISKMVSSTEKVLGLTTVVDTCLQKVDLILREKQGLTQQQELLEETEREVQKLKLQRKQMADRVITCSEVNKDEAKSLISIDTSQEGIEERLSWMSSFTEWTILKKSAGKIHFGFLCNTLILAVGLLDNSSSCLKISSVHLHSRLAAGSKPWAKLAHHLLVRNVDCQRLQASYTEYNQMHQLLADVSANVCDFRQFSMELKLAHLKHCLTVDDNRLKFTISNRKTRQKITLTTTVAADYHPHNPLVWTAATLIGSVSSQDVKSAVDQIVKGPNYMTRVLSQTEQLLAIVTR
ncbi:hypothetical protein BsWGS_10563 [Bradybaena similaris]